MAVNFRPIMPDIPPTKASLFRSATLDITDVDTVRDVRDTYGIRTILDLRNKNEYAHTAKKSPINAFYSTYESGSDACLSRCPEEEDDLEKPRRRYLLKLLSIEFYLVVFFRLTFIQKIIIIGYLIRHLFTKDYAYERYAGEVYMVPQGLAQQYVQFLENCKKQFRGIFQLLADEKNYPILVTCYAGKDRTGAVSALIMDLMEVDRATIVSAYAQSEENIRPIRDAMVRFFKSKGLTDDFVKSKPEYIQEFLNHIDTRYGNTASYLQSIGITSDEIAKIKKNVLQLRN